MNTFGKTTSRHASLYLCLVLCSYHTCLAPIAHCLAGDRSLEDADGYHAFVIDCEDEGRVEAFRKWLDRRCGFKVTAIGTAMDVNYPLKRFRSQCTNGCQVAMICYRGQALLRDNEVVLEYAESQSIKASDCLAVLAECGGQAGVLIVDGVGNEDIAKLATTLSSMLEAHEVPLHAIVHVGPENTSISPAMERLFQQASSQDQYGTTADLANSLSMGEIRLALCDHPNTLILSNQKGSQSSAISLVRTRPLRLEELLEDFAETIADYARQEGITAVAVPEFTLVDGWDIEADVPGQNYGLMLRWCGDWLRKELKERANLSYDVLSDKALRGVLTSSNVQRLTRNRSDRKQLLTDFNTIYRELGKQHLMEAVEGRPILLLLPTLRHDLDNPACVWLEGLAYSVCESTSDPGNNVTAVQLQDNLNGIALLTPTEVGLTGYSGTNTPVKEFFTAWYKDAPSTQKTSYVKPPSALDYATVFASSSSDQDRRKVEPQDDLDLFREQDRDSVKNRVAEMAKNRTHPMLKRKDAESPWVVDTDCDFFVSVWTADGEKQLFPSSDGQHLYVKMSPGEKYKIFVRNQSPGPVFMRLLVDGLNTLPDRCYMNSDGLHVVAQDDEHGQLLPAQVADLNHAREWYCEPGDWLIRGFYTSIDGASSELTRDAELAAFEVTDATDSEAWRTGYKEDIGIITAAFFAPVAKLLTAGPAERYGTKLGEREQTKVEMYGGEAVPGELIEVVHIRYGISPDTEEKP